MIKINLDKAKAISHEIRRSERTKEFAPLDEIIAKQIPGVSAQEAEQQRQLIREKYAAVQESIDASSSVDDLLVIVNEIKT